jgi:hypothetical protein
MAKVTTAYHRLHCAITARQMSEAHEVFSDIMQQKVAERLHIERIDVLAEALQVRPAGAPGAGSIAGGVPDDYFKQHASMNVAGTRPCYPCPGMSTDDFNRWKDARGKTCYTGPDGTVKVDIEITEIPDARRKMAPNFAPDKNVLGFVAVRPDGSSPMAVYQTPNIRTKRPALFPSIAAAKAALSAPRDKEYPRISYDLKFFN